MKLDVNYDRWKYPHYSYDDAEKLIAQDIMRDGIHSVFMHSKSPPIDYLSVGFEDLVSDYFLVVLSGAVTESTRKNSSPPYFSGASLASNLKVPLLAVSDPTLMLNPDLTLGWYAGNKYTPNLSADVASLVNEVAKISGRHPIFIGGSGGGFASIQLLRRIEVPAAALVWNPQTSIGMYYLSAVKRYLVSAFPDLRIPNDTAKSAPDIQKFMDENMDRGQHRLPKVSTLESNKRLIYLQNISDDYHLKNHAGPWLNSTRFNKIGPGMYLANEQDFIFFVGDWGMGHASPPLGLIKLVLRDLTDGKSPATISTNLAKTEYLIKQRLTWFNANPSAVKLATLNVQVKNDTFYTTVVVAPELGKEEDFQYAFELYSGGNLITQRWYQNASHASFKTSLPSANYRIKAYLMDRLGSIRSIYKDF